MRTKKWENYKIVQASILRPAYERVPKHQLLRLDAAKVKCDYGEPVPAALLISPTIRYP